MSSSSSQQVVFSSSQPWKGSSFDYYEPSTPDPDEVFKNFNSSVQWAVAGQIIIGLVGAIALVAIVYAIIDCLKKTGTAIPSYARLATSERTDYNASKQESSSKHVAIAMEPEFPVIRDSQVEYATMERFLGNIAREKPIRFSPEQIAQFTNDCSTILGSGGYGVVFKGELPDGTPVAVKVLNVHSNRKSIEAQFMAEVSTIGRTYHINLVRLYGFTFDTSMMALVYEYMENGSLNRFLFDESREIEWEKLRDIAIGTAKGIAYLHEDCQQRIVHYDIKPENILLDENFNPKVADFGLAKLCNRESSQVTMSGGRGTLGYSAPEVWRRNFPVTHKCDVYSFGILLFEIISRRRHFNENLSESRQWLPRWTWDMYKNNEMEVMLTLCGVEQKDREKAERMSIVALLCIQYSPDARPLMSDVVKMLEGHMEVHQPENPFAYLESTGVKLMSDSGSNGYLSKSASPGSTSGQPYLNSPEATFEIEIAS